MSIALGTSTDNGTEVQRLHSNIRITTEYIHLNDFAEAIQQ